MRWQRVLWCVGAVTLAFGPGCEAPSPSTDPPADSGQRKPRPPVEDWGYLRGVVSAVGPDWFELAANWEGGGTVKTDLGDTAKPRLVLAAGTKLGGDPKGDERGDDRHWVSDLKVGDVVAVGVYVGRDGSDWPMELLITRRPGGMIPPLHCDFPIHLRFQAQQDWEEKGIPIPDKYLPPDGRIWWTNPPYPPEAPMPREVRPLEH